jgi:hypothetical protein
MLWVQSCTEYYKLWYVNEMMNREIKFVFGWQTYPMRQASSVQVRRELNWECTELCGVFWVSSCDVIRSVKRVKVTNPLFLDQYTAPCFWYVCIKQVQARKKKQISQLIKYFAKYLSWAINSYLSAQIHLIICCYRIWMFTTVQQKFATGLLSWDSIIEGIWYLKPVTLTLILLPFMSSHLHVTYVVVHLRESPNWSSSSFNTYDKNFLMYSSSLEVHLVSSFLH